MNLSSLFFLCLFILSVSVGNASALACSEFFRIENSTALHIQNLARENFKNKISTTGYKSIEQIREGIKRGQYSVSLEDLAVKFTAGLRAPENLRDKIVSQGFKNQHELKSRGADNLEKMVDTESGIYGLSKEDFAKIPDKDKPLYGALVAFPEFSKIRNGSLDRYGFDLWITKRHVVDRSTWTTTDSWALKNDFMGFGWDKKAKLFAERDWTHIAMPAETLDLAIPFLSIEGRVHFPHKSIGPESFYRGQIMPPRSVNIVNFIEFQIWGGLKPSDISDFVFYKEPPTQEQLQAFKDAGIKVWDGRQDTGPIHLDL